MRQHHWLWIFVGFLIAVSGTWWYIGRVNSTHPAIWGMVGGDAGNRNLSRVALPKNPQILWSHALGTDGLLLGNTRIIAAPTPPVVWQDGTIYFGYGSKLYAMGPDGKQKWAWQSQTPINRIALGRQGTVYVHVDGMLYAMKPDGTMEWQVEVDVHNNEARGLTVGQGGVIYVTGRQYLVAVSSTGQRKWRFKGENITAAPAELQDGKLAVTIGDQLYLLTRDGDTVWNRPAVIPASPFGIASADNRIYLYGSERFVLDSKGNAVTRADTAGTTSLLFSIGKDFLQDGLDRYDVTWRDQTWSKRSPEERVLASISLADQAGNVVLLTITGSNARNQRSTLRMLDARGEEKWVLKEAMSAGVPVPAGEGRLCFIGNLSNQNGMYLICIGDR